MNDLHAFIDRIVERDHGGVYQRLADNLGMTLSALKRAVMNGTFSVENCLVLAKAAGVPPSKVLTLAGKGHIAELIESLYGRPALSLTDADRRLLLLTLEQKRAVLALVDRR